MKPMNKTLLDQVTAEKQKAINKNFLQEWVPFDQKNKMVERALVKHFGVFGRGGRRYYFQKSHDKSSREPFSGINLERIKSVLGLAYTSGSSFAGLWCCNSGYLMATDTHYFIGFAINTDNEVIGICHDESENEYFVKIK